MRKICAVLALVASPLVGDEKVFQIKHRSAESLSQLLLIPNLGVRASRDFNTISITGTAETIKVAEGIIQQYDTPSRQADLVLRVVEASSRTEGPNDAADLVPAELKSMLRYQRYALLDSAVLRGMEAERLRAALAGNLTGTINFRVRDAGPPPVLEMRASLYGPPVTIRNSKGVEETTTPTLLETTTTMKSGETVVLGASKMRGGSNALIVLLTAKVLP